MPGFARRAAGAVARPLLEAATGKAEAAELARRFGSGEEPFWGAAVVFDETLKGRLVSAEMRARLGGLSSYEVVREDLERVARERPASDFLARMTYLELKLRLPELLLMRVDKMTMATSVEARVPFLDHHLVEYAMGVPRALKVEGRSGKHVLKRALEGVLPRDVLYRPKRGFGAPVEGWFRGASAAELGVARDELRLTPTGAARLRLCRAPLRRAPPRRARPRLPPLGAPQPEPLVRALDRGERKLTGMDRMNRIRIKDLKSQICLLVFPILSILSIPVNSFVHHPGSLP